MFHFNLVLGMIALDTESSVYPPSRNSLGDGNAIFLSSGIHFSIIHGPQI